MYTIATQAPFLPLVARLRSLMVVDDPKLGIGNVKVTHNCIRSTRGDSSGRFRRVHFCAVPLPGYRGTTPIFLLLLVALGLLRYSETDAQKNGWWSGTAAQW